ncbi:MAG TPA: efflux RND transporter periplasmic adaptor subunit [Thermoanaerobaculia bacterium]|nr:efflux RND transporter periplasmic adaptor subunit [Thermoanaerobaculia bacterium]
MNARKQFLTTLALVSVLLSATACKRTESKTKEDAGKGPHGGKLLTKDDFGLEVKIFEEGVPPEFRLYAFDDGKPVAPTQFNSTITLERLEQTDTINFAPRGDYLVGDKEIYEPHSFDVIVKATRGGQSYQWTYSSYEGRTQVNPEELSSANVVIERVGPARMKNVVELPGQIALNADKTAHVVPRLSGVVTEVRKNLGDRVTRGEVIAVLDSGDLATAKQAYIESVQRLELARSSAAREEALWRKKISPEEDYLIRKQAFEEAKLTWQATTQRLAALGLPAGEIRGLRSGQGTLARYALRAPLTGVVIAKNVTVGEAVEATGNIFTVADLSSVWADITVPPNQLGAIRTGQPVIVQWEAQDMKVAGTVTYVESLVGEETRSSRARVVIANPNGVWRPGLFVKVLVTQNETTVPMAVKAEALQTFRDWEVVFIKVGNLFEARPLEMGRREGEWIEVLSGLKPGLEYAAKNSFVVKADVMKSGASHDH